MIALSAQALLAILAMPAAVQESSPRTELPVEAPPGWESKEQNSSLLFTPKDLGAGETYTVLVPGLLRKAGNVRGLLEIAKATLGQVGEFKPAHEPAGARNEAGWEFEVLIGTLTKNGKPLMGQALGVRKGDKEGIILVVSDSLATMQKYSGAFNTMVQSIGVPKAAPAAAAVDLEYTVPSGWKAVPQGASVVLTLSNEETKGPSDRLKKYQLLLFPSQPMKDGLRKAYLDLWETLIKPTFETSIMPIPMIRRMKFGALCAFDLDSGSKFKNGQSVPGGWMDVGFYLLAQGNRVVPMVGVFISRTGDLDEPLLSFLESARIPNATGDKIGPFAGPELAGAWTEASIAIANYVQAGQVVGDASIYTGSDLTLNADGTFKSRFVAIIRGSTLVTQDEGKWAVDDCILTLQGKSVERYVVHGAGRDAKVGAFLVLSRNANTDMQLRMGDPRGYFQSTTFKKKD